MKQAPLPKRRSFLSLYLLLRLLKGFLFIPLLSLLCIEHPLLLRQQLEAKRIVNEFLPLPSVIPQINRTFRRFQREAVNISQTLIAIITQPSGSFSVVPSLTKPSGFNTGQLTNTCSCKHLQMAHRHCYPTDFFSPARGASPSYLPLRGQNIVHPKPSPLKAGPSPHRPLLGEVRKAIDHSGHGQAALLQHGQPVTHEEVVGAAVALRARHGGRPPRLHSSFTATPRRRCCGRPEER